MLWWLMVGLSLGAILTGVSKNFVVRMNMLDVPGARSSHKQVTPRGGGVSIVIASFAGFLLLPENMRYAVVAPALLIAAVGLWDDYQQASRRLRLLIQLVGALIAVLYVQPPSLVVLGFTIGGALLLALLVIWYVWCTNLYNFMDGINGIAGAQAVSVLLSMVLLLGGVAEVSAFVLLMAGACLGFLLWNFPRAYIFMGDAGSAFLGAFFAGLSVYYLAHQPALFWALVILLGVFVVDSSVTLINRARLRQRIFDAHRSHAYQYASRTFNSHTKVTLLVVLINGVWLLPWASVAAKQILPGFVALVAAYLPLVILAIRLKAGVPEKV